ncbi:MAG: hypothetical protein LVQ97_01580 [Candidatus Micrarchaeales archaeon]|jgi:ribosomal protein L24E|uniref:Large ribosomal subunit protein eL24-related N-terminal domain-containing protein n=1 Tax=Candidatus Micrarchaeum acidiphilum ARMAN-2 TaxID=425595 RepID=C7DI35_MICA2|nr:MAG: hypothetical protein UNLARM2_0727 [Candidatus Micrarchaeum acidiphilum ARMAN-2]MCW6160858.1 hypothetical protein [Candidatus Micrarchaeales archaeon]
MKCTYCQNEIRRGSGTMYVFKTGKINYYCSGRCYKNDIIYRKKMNLKENRIKAKPKQSK